MKAVIKRKFYQKLNALIQSKESNNSFLSGEKYGLLIQQHGNRKKEPKDNQLLKRYDVVQVGNVEKLIYPVAEGRTSIKYYVQIEDIFNVIHETHVSIGHGGRNRMVKETGTKYKNITAECIMIYLNLCIPCLKKSKVLKKGLVVKPMSRAHVDLTDMQSQADGEYRWIFVYQDHRAY